MSQYDTEVDGWILVHDGSTWCVCQQHTGNVGTQETLEQYGSEQECLDRITELGLTERSPV